MNNKTVNIYSYITTIFWAMFAACLFSGAIIYYAQYDVINNASSRYNERMLNEYIKNTVISQNEDLEAEHPNDYRIDIHLGYLHKVIREYNKAEMYYKKAVQKAPLGVYKPLYELGSFYVETDRLKDAREALESLPDKSGKTLIKYQSYLCRKLGDAYYKKGLYYYALENYEEAMYYWNKQRKPGTNYTKEVNKKIFQSTINIADICVNDNKIDEAILFLKRAEKIYPKNFNVLYKLALTTANNKPEESYKYFKTVFKSNPVKVDYTAYYKLLDNLSAKYEFEGDYVNAKLFAFRAKNLINIVSEEIIYPKDIDFKVTGTTLYKLNKKYKILIKYNLQNISNMPIKKLNMDVVYKLDNKIIEEYTKQILEPNQTLLIGDSLNESTIIPNLFRKYKNSEIPKLTAEIYLYKTKDNKICVFKDNLFEQQQKVEIKQSKQSLDCQSYIKFFAHQILHIKYAIQSYIDSL